MYIPHVQAANECRIYYSCYKESLQEDAARLVGLKKKASLTLEGVFSEDLLSAMAEKGWDFSALFFVLLTIIMVF